MEGLEAIKKTIMDKAQKEVASILQRAEQEATDILQQNESACRAILDEAYEQGKSQADFILNRARSLAALERRKSVLQARQDLIEKGLDQALCVLCEMPDDEKIGFYQCLIKQSGMTEGTLILSASDQKLGEQVIADPKFKLTLSTESGSFVGGLVIRKGLIEENLTFESLIEKDRPLWVTLAASILFGQGSV